MSQPKVSGKFVEALAASAGAVSPVFEQKIEQYLRYNGIDSVDPGAWYSYEQFASAVTDVEEDIGSMTAMDAGAEMIATAEEIADMSSIAETMELAQDVHSAAYRNFTPETVGQWSHEYTDTGNSRIAAYGGWRYPRGFTQGIVKGYAKASNDVVQAEITETATTSDEVFAFVVQS